MKFSKKALIGAAATVAALGVGGGVAFAAWTVSGSGGGSGAATVAQSLTITEVQPTSAQSTIFPGAPPQPVYFEVANPNPFAVTITGITWGSPTSSNTSACASSNITVDSTAPTTVSISIPANATAGTVYSVAGVLDLNHAAGNGCEGVTFNVPMTVSANQA